MNQSTENLLHAIDPEEYVTIVSPEKYKKKGNKEKWPKLKQFLLNLKQQEFIGRPNDEWTKLTIFYICFYSSLLLYFGILIGIFSAVLDEITPWQTGKESPLKDTPGLSFRPMPFLQTKLVRFIQGKPETYKPYTDHVQVFLLEYENEKQVGENFIDCEKGKGEDQLWKVCRFNIDTLGGMCTWQRDYGYDEGKPCAIVKINRVIGWVPEPLTDEDRDRDDIPAEIWDRWREDHIPISCRGRYAADNENIGNVSYWPPEGFPKFFFPYLNQEGFRSPLVMIRFDNPANGILINVDCRIWARNIPHLLNDQIGVVTFEIMVD